ncbi:tannase/feruloyl esterase family alpha/beta hydrolase [uncultured Sphingopyxis sp.]|nr:tannase/feruloyl esterase family alpha/beta hydrolase [uncultured Sphingopyxis sp.]
MIATAIGAFAPHAAQAADCEGLTALDLPNVEIRSASPVAPGTFSEPSRGGRPGDSHDNVPAFCRVAGIASPEAGSRIGFEVWLPAPDAWSQRLHMIGNGGYGSNLYWAQLVARVQRGDVAVATDTGHSGSSLTFGIDNPVAIVDWGNRAAHASVVAAKGVVKAYYGRPQRWSYFSGSSTGGHQALMLAQRHPEDFDGIIAGAPGNNRTALNFQFMWNFLSNHRRGDNSTQIVPNRKLPMIRRAVVAACDADDGVIDGVITEPLKCGFDVGALACPGAETANCLTAEQVATMRAIYRGPRNARTGEQLYPGLTLGSEGMGGDEANPGWADFWANPDKPDEPQRADFFRYWVFKDANWNWWNFDWDKDVDTVQRVIAPVVNATDPDISAFRARGGKLIMFMGWDDPVGSSVEAINYYDSVVARGQGADEAARLADTQSFARLYMIPGMGHTAGGPGATHVSTATRDSAPPVEDARHDMGLALYDWVERGTAPEALIGTHFSSGTGATGTVQFQRPICVYPKVARYAGGDPNSAESFRCEPATRR